MSCVLLVSIFMLAPFHLTMQMHAEQYWIATFGMSDNVGLHHLDCHTTLDCDIWNVAQC
jgi:hypothetical protein